MRLEEAVEILNKNKHRDCDTWQIKSRVLEFESSVFSYHCFKTDICYCFYLDGFEAIAIAKKYQEQDVIL